jgi:glycosidase
MAMRLKVLVLSLFSLAAVQAAAQECRPAPHGTTTLYLRGGMNGWGNFENFAFTYKCDAYYLNVNSIGLQEFKVADAGWTPTLTYGASSPAELRNGLAAPMARGSDAAGAGNIKFRFGGDHTVRLAIHEGRADLTVGPQSFADDSVRPVTDKVALSLSHDSRALADKKPFGAAPAGSSIQFGLNALPGVTSATLVVELRRLEGNQEVLEYKEVARVPMQAGSVGEGQRWSAEYRFDQPGVYAYYVDVVIGGQRYTYQNNRNAVYWTLERGTNGLGAVEHHGAQKGGVRRFRQTVHAKDYTVPSWARDAVYYYIFPERFRNGDKSNDPVPGRDRYQDNTVELHKNWLDSPYRPGSGDGSDKLSNNDFYGGDLQGIIEKLDYIKSVGANTIYMTPVFEAPSNHKYDTADYRNIDCRFGSNADFTRLSKEARKRGIRVITDASFNHTGSDSAYFDRYGNYPASGAFEGGKVNPQSPYASWYKFEPDNKYKGWAGTQDLPELDKSSPAFRQFAFGAPDSITRLWLKRGAAGWRMDVAPWVPDDFWRAWRKVVKQHDRNALTIAETWFDASKYFLGDTFDSTMNYIFRNAVLDYASGLNARVAWQNIELMREAYPRQAFYALMNLLSTHDAARSLHVLGDHGGDPAAASLAMRRYRLALLLQMTMPGAPAIYYGDEVGLNGGDDPLNRAAYPWQDLGGKQDASLLAFTRQLTALRAKHKVLRHGSFEAPVHTDDNVIVLLRRDGMKQAVIATNNADIEKRISVNLPGVKAKLELTLPPLGGVVLLGSSNKLTVAASTHR